MRRTHQLQNSQAAGESGTHSGTPQTSNEHCQDQIGDPGTVEGGG